MHFWIASFCFLLVSFDQGLSGPFHTDRESRGTFYLSNPLYSTCTGKDGRDGYCLFQGCFVNNLRYQGRCGFGLGSCCLAEQSCLRSTNVNNTYFVNSGYPNPTTSLGSCEMTVKRRTQDICQIRLDFLEFDLEQPDDAGVCLNDVFVVKGAKSAVPPLCGNNKGQHLYFDVDPLDNQAEVTLSVSINEFSLLQRTWNIKVTQIGCSSLEKAPSGCLQFYTGDAGIVNSFNFASSINETRVSRQLANLAYSICVRQESEVCSISWTTNSDEGKYAFTLTGDVTAVNEEDLGSPKLSSQDCAEGSDYILIPNGVDQDGHITERLCGLGFVGNVTTNLTPFILHANSGPNEKGDNLNRGFSLVYQQNNCTTTADSSSSSGSSSTSTSTT